MKSIFICVFAALLLWSCSKNETWEANGTFEATEVTVSAQSTGVILSFDVEEGNKVSAGVQVGTIDTVQLYLKKLQLERQRASVINNRPDINKQTAALKEQIAQTKTEKQRIENLLKDGAATQKQLDDINATLKVLSGQLEAQISTLGKSAGAIDENSSALELQIAQTEDLLSKCRITSPITGIVVAKYCQKGELANVARPLMRVAQMDKMYLRAYFTSEQLSKLKIGQSVGVVADFGAEEQIEYKGKITWIASDSEFTPKTIQTKNSRANLVYAVKIAVENDGRLKLGLLGRVKAI